MVKCGRQKGEVGNAREKCSQRTNPSVLRTTGNNINLA
ncbi:uncharacterized protein G2W53_019719 [Senna tora]|uniref:Uncharacterized protein n=1 Tax=Senna tora TaxID=362788 RepID=A0A834TTX9_9FABA|nr:uncharacterized protein G2W53_019719 [Senna tora]